MTQYSTDTYSEPSTNSVGTSQEKNKMCGCIKMSRTTYLPLALVSDWFRTPPWTPKSVDAQGPHLESSIWIETMDILPCTLKHVYITYNTEFNVNVM